MAIEKVEYEFPDPDADGSLEIEVEGSSMEPLGDASNDTEAKKPGKKEEADTSDNFEIEVVDDTPPEDRNREPGPPPDDVTDEELGEYSEKVRKRISRLSKGYHDERRAKEAAERERVELERITQQLMNENKALKGDASKSKAALLEQAKKVVANEVEVAKRQYREAYESGEADKVVEAQDALTAAKLKASRLDDLPESSLQTDEDDVNIQTQDQFSAPQTDQKAVAWQKANTWFGQDEEMTSLALGLHQKLVNEGIDPRSDKYYEAINARMRQLFPDRFDDTKEPAKNTDPTPRSATVVAPASRSTAPRKVVLSKTQQRLAKRLGLTLEQYARQVAIEERKAQ